MRRALTTMLTATTAVALVAATTLPAGAAEPDGPTPSAITWAGPLRTDPIGDDGGAGRADIDQFQMSYDSATDELVVEARILDAPAGSWSVGVYVDLDRHRSTGCTGADWLVAVQMDGVTPESQLAGALDECAGWPSAVPLTADFLPAFGYMTLRIPRAALGSPVSLDWTLVAATDPIGVDFAPDPPAMAEEFGWVQPFDDVRTDAFYSGPIAWLRQAGLSTGVGGTGDYDPDGPVTRAQMATFIWRIEDEPAAPLSPFTDIQRPSFYAAAVDWLHRAGLTTGVGGSDRFAPNDPVTRAQMVTFLWRYAGSPDGYPAPGFDDVTDPGAYYHQAVAWAKAEGITTGIGGTNEFRPDDVVSRGQLATFLQRALSPLGEPVS